MSEHLSRAQRCHRAIREVFLHEWDPIGVSNFPQAQDEYDSYVAQVYAFLIRREPLYKIVEFLWWVETQHMGLCGNRRRTEQVAERLLQVPEAITGCD